MAAGPAGVDGSGAGRGSSSRSRWPRIPRLRLHPGPSANRATWYGDARSPVTSARLRALGCHLHLDVVGDVDALLVSARTSACTLLAADEVRGGELMDVLVALGEVEGPVPTVVLGHVSGDEATIRGAPSVCEVIPPGPDPWAFVGSILALTRRSFVEGIPGQLRWLDFDPSPHNETVRDALERACFAEAPLTTVQELCRRVGTHRSTLWSAWRRVFGKDALSPKELLTAIVLARALENNRAGLSWGTIARRWRVDHGTLARIGKRLTGEAPSALDGRAPVTVSRAIVRGLGGRHPPPGTDRR